MSQKRSSIPGDAFTGDAYATELPIGTQTETITMDFGAAVDVLGTGFGIELQGSKVVITYQARPQMPFLTTEATTLLDETAGTEFGETIYRRLRAEFLRQLVMAAVR